MPLKAEAVAMMESAVGYGKARYLLKIEDLMAVREAEGEAAATEAMEEPGQAPTPAQGFPTRISHMAVPRASVV